MAGKHAWVGVGVHTVPEVEDVARMRGAVGRLVVAQHLCGAGERRFDAGEHERRIEVALHDESVAEAIAGVGDRRAPIEPDDRGARLDERLEQVIAADAEMDRRRVGMAASELAEHVTGVGEHVPVVVAPAESAGPRIEELEGGGAVAELCVDERDRRLGEPFHDLVPQDLVVVDQRLGVAVVLARTSLDQVARHGERGAGEARGAVRRSSATRRSTVAIT